uniref:Uncharacterized protein n=1 Tax=viral metagenome TaxID=1070528 RepID=A0A6C0BMU0_9ZZZZ
MSLTLRILRKELSDLPAYLVLSYWTPWDQWQARWRDLKRSFKILRRKEPKQTTQWLILGLAYLQLYFQKWSRPYSAWPMVSNNKVMRKTRAKWDCPCIVKFSKKLMQMIKDTWREFGKAQIPDNRFGRVINARYPRFKRALQYYVLDTAPQLHSG